MDVFGVLGVCGVCVALLEDKVMFRISFVYVSYILTPFSRDLTLFSSFLQGIIQASLSYALAASVGFALLCIVQASLTLLSLIAKIRVSFVEGMVIL